MIRTTRTAQVTWEGDLEHAGGQLALGSGALTNVPISWRGRSQKPDGLSARLEAA